MATHPFVALCRRPGVSYAQVRGALEEDAALRSREGRSAPPPAWAATDPHVAPELGPALPTRAEVRAELERLELPELRELAREKGVAEAAVRPLDAAAPDDAAARDAAVALVLAATATAPLQTCLHVLCANACVAEESDPQRSAVTELARRTPASLTARNDAGATPLELLVAHGGLTPALLMALLELCPAIALTPLRHGCWWETRRESTPLHWLCAQEVPAAEAGALAAAVVRLLAAGEAAAERIDSGSGRSPLHELCANRCCKLAALRALARAAPGMVTKPDRAGHKPPDLLETNHLLTSECLACLVEANPQAAAARLALPPWEQSEWAQRRPPAMAAADAVSAKDEAEREQTEQLIAAAATRFQDLTFELQGTSEGAVTGAAIQIRRFYEAGDGPVRQGAVEVPALVEALVALLHRPRCSAPRNAAAAALGCLADGDERLAERIRQVKSRELKQVKLCAAFSLWSLSRPELKVLRRWGAVSRAARACGGKRLRSGGSTQGRPSPNR